MLWVCSGCTTRYAGTLQVCPNCGCEERRAAHDVDNEATAPRVDSAGNLPEETGGKAKKSTQDTGDAGR